MLVPCYLGVLIVSKILVIWNVVMFSGSMEQYIILIVQILTLTPSPTLLAEEAERKSKEGPSHPQGI